MKAKYKIKKEVVDLVNEFRKVHKTDKKRFEEIQKIFKEKYKMTAYDMVALFYNPPILEYNFNNRHLLFEGIINKLND